MKHLLFLLSLCLISNLAYTQKVMNQASLDEHGMIQVERVEVDYPDKTELRQGEPELILTFGAEAFPTTKNTRGVTLADIDGDGVEEILFGIYDTLYAIKSDGSILWKQDVSGPILLPPTVADLDGDGNLEIVVNSGYPRAGGGVTLVDKDGNHLDGWPVTFDGNWMSNAPVVVDLDGDGVMEIVTVEYISASVGHVHVLNLDGTPFNENWPVDIKAPPAFTPSIGDVNGDGNKDIVIASSSKGMNVLNLDGELLDGFPIKHDGVSYSYQSPILADMDGDGKLEIIGTNHGDNPSIYVMKADGSFMDGWPLSLDSWTYAPPTVADVNGDGSYEVFAGVPVVDNEGGNLPVIYGLKADGSDLENFPIEKHGGNEGVIAIADINDDGVLDIIFGSNLFDDEKKGFIHAYSMDGSGELDGFPLRPAGMTFLNGAVLGDVNDDGKLDLTVMSYKTHFGADIDSAFVQVYNLDYPYKPENILRNGYKGSNTRDGLVLDESSTSVVEIESNTLTAYPNPSSGMLNLKLENGVQEVQINVIDVHGRLVHKESIRGAEKEFRINLHQLTNGVYFIDLKLDKETVNIKWIKN